VNGNQNPPILNHAFAEVVEGFYLETKDGSFFAVKGMEHPPDRRIAVLRYVPDASGGDRRKGDTSYRRLYHFDEQERLIRATCPQYLAYDPIFQTTLQSVPVDRVHAIYDPRRKFRELSEMNTRVAIEDDAFAFLRLLQYEARVPPSGLGITGSLLTGLYTEKSDLDAVVYGTENCNKVCQVLRRILDASQGGELQRLDAAGMEELFAQRATDTSMDYDAFLALEKRKVNQGLFRKRPWFVRFVKEAHEVSDIYGRLRYTPQGRAVITASIADDCEAIFTPCRYPLSAVRILEGPQVPDLREIVSFRGRFCEQARTGETVIASGTLERIEDNHGDIRHRLLLGNFREDGMNTPGI
jgi:predicted nucleotidyltransferase